MHLVDLPGTDPVNNQFSNNFIKILSAMAFQPSNLQVLRPQIFVELLIRL